MTRLVLTGERTENNDDISTPLIGVYVQSFSREVATSAPLIGMTAAKTHTSTKTIPLHHHCSGIVYIFIETLPF